MKTVRFNENIIIVLIEQYDRRPIEFINKLHFSRRICNLKSILNPILEKVHRKKIFKLRFAE
jgi:hypothetical protein